VIVTVNFGRLLGPARRLEISYRLCHRAKAEFRLTSRDILNLPHNEHAVLTQNLSKYAMLAVKEGCWCGGDEELEREGRESASAVSRVGKGMRDVPGSRWYRVQSWPVEYVEGQRT
jgi:hypothetical protein